MMRTVLCASLALAGAAVVVVAQATTRPGEMTQARVWVENRSPHEAIPVVLQTPRALPVSAARQSWEYRSIPLASGAEPARGLADVGLEGWEAVGVLQSGPAGTTVLFKRPR